MRRVCIVQARMASTRLPGKVLRDLAGRPMLAQLLRRLRSCTALDDILVATSVAASDDRISDLGMSEGVRVVRGSEADVLGRMVQAARVSEADIVVRVTADCPLIDPQVVDRVVGELSSHGRAIDYASNVLRRTFPRGLDVEAMFVDTLLRVDRLATSQAEREHVTITIRSELPSLFVTRSVESETDDSDLRWTVDEESDLVVVANLYDAFGLNDRIVPYGVLVEYVREHPELMRINSGVATWAPPIDEGRLAGKEAP